MASPWLGNRISRSYCRANVVYFDKEGLTEEGFAGFTSFAELTLSEVPQSSGVYAVLMPEDFAPRFLVTNTGGHFKGKDPSVAEDILSARWVTEAEVLYIGKAGAGKTAKRGLRKRIQEFADFGRGAPVGHWGGRLLWQLADSQDLVIAWKVLPPGLVDATEARYHADFLAVHGQLPFANLVQARTPQT